MKLLKCLLYMWSTCAMVLALGATSLLDNWSKWFWWVLEPSTHCPFPPPTHSSYIYLLLMIFLKFEKTYSKTSNSNQLLVVSTQDLGWYSWAWGRYMYDILNNLYHCFSKYHNHSFIHSTNISPISSVVKILGFSYIACHELQKKTKSQRWCGTSQKRRHFNNPILVIRQFWSWVGICIVMYLNI